MNNSTSTSKRWGIPVHLVLRVTTMVGSLAFVVGLIATILQNQPLGLVLIFGGLTCVWFGVMMVVIYVPGFISGDVGDFMSFRARAKDYGFVLVVVVVLVFAAIPVMWPRWGWLDRRANIVHSS